MSDPNLHHPSLHAAPWHIVTERRGSIRPGEADMHTLHHGSTPTEQRPGPHGLSILSDIRDHLNQCGGKPTLPKPNHLPPKQPSLF